LLKFSCPSRVPFLDLGWIPNEIREILTYSGRDIETLIEELWVKEEIESLAGSQTLKEGGP